MQKVPILMLLLWIRFQPWITLDTFHMDNLLFLFQFISVPHMMVMMMMTFMMVLTIMEKIQRAFLVFHHGFWNRLLMNLLYELCMLYNLTL